MLHIYIQLCGILSVSPIISNAANKQYDIRISHSAYSCVLARTDPSLLISPSSEFVRRSRFVMVMLYMYAIAIAEYVAVIVGVCDGDAANNPVEGYCSFCRYRVRSECLSAAFDAFCTSACSVACTNFMAPRMKKRSVTCAASCVSYAAGRSDKCRWKNASCFLGCISGACILLWGLGEVSGSVVVDVDVDVGCGLLLLGCVTRSLLPNSMHFLSGRLVLFSPIAFWLPIPQSPAYG